MIIGLGSDLIDIRRVEDVLAKHEERFLERVFTDIERASGRDAAHFAKRWAAKEAASKALGTGIQAGVHLHDIGVVSNENGAPSLQLTGGAAARLQAITPAGHISKIWLTLSDEPPLAQALVIIEAIPAK